VAVFSDLLGSLTARDGACNGIKHEYPAERKLTHGHAQIVRISSTASSPAA
jgi:hypothetical protein